MNLDFLIGLLQNALGGIAAQALVNVPGLFAQLFKERAREMKGPEICRMLEQLGAASAADIRALVYRQLARDRRLSNNQREDVAALLISVSRGATLLNSQGGPCSTFIRSEDIVERLLGSLRPKRKAGEKVLKNHDWVLRHFLGMGTFGEVWMAQNGRAPGLAVRAYKFFTHEGATGWLEREKDTLMAIREKLKGQPHVVELIDVTVPDEDGYPFLALEFVGGGSLEDWITDARRSERPLRKREIIRALIRALAAAHKQGVYHCDLKPANILLTKPPDVQPKITDFGLSSVEGPLPGDPQPLLQAGTPMYWPPEAQRPFAEHQPALYDVFALGVIWYQLVVERLERPPYDFPAELKARGEDSHTVQLISRCLAHPDRRFRDAFELGEHMDDTDLPVWDPVPPGVYDVQHLVREYVSLAAR